MALTKQVLQEEEDGAHVPTTKIFSSSSSSYEKTGKMERTGSDFVRMSFEMLKGDFWEEEGLLSLPAVGCTKHPWIQLQWEVFMILRNKYLYILERWLLKKIKVQRESVGSP